MTILDHFNKRRMLIVFYSTTEGGGTTDGFILFAGITWTQAHKRMWKWVEGWTPNRVITITDVHRV